MQGNQDLVITSDELLNHWQGHRRLTRRVIEAFPEEALFNYSLGGMRPFAKLALELLQMAAPIAKGVATGEWSWSEWELPPTKAEILKLWDEATTAINEAWSAIPSHRFQEVDKAFGMWEGTGISTILYAIDNEVHHRGQGYVYLRSLGIEPPPFYERD